ncbi:putative ATP-dependent RNA helicase DDX46 [Styela clava]
MSDNSESVLDNVTDELKIKIKEEKSSIEKTAKKERKDGRKRSRSRSNSRDRSSRKGGKYRRESPSHRRRHGRSYRSRRSKSRSRSRSKGKKSSSRRSRERRDKKSDSSRRRKQSSSSSSSSSDGESNAEKADKSEKKPPEAKAETSTVTKSTNKERRSKERGEKSRDRRSRRSRSRDKRRRSSRERRRSRSRNRDSRSKKPSRHSRQSSKEKETTKSSSDKKEAEKTKELNTGDFEQAKLEEEMKKRRDRVEMWRKEQKSALLKAGDGDSESANGDDSGPRKTWTLEDDDDDDLNEETADNDLNEETADREEKDEKMEEETNEISNEKDMSIEEAEDEVDPLDAFMMNLESQSDSVYKKNASMTENTDGPKISRVVAVAKSKNEIEIRPEKRKGELMEADVDAMEYSSEEEEESLSSAFNKFQSKQRNRKLDTVIDHTKIKYEPFRKSFYVEVPELAALTEEEVAERRMELENVKVRGKNCPKPIKSWAQVGVSFKVLNALKKAKFEKPTAIQSQALPAIMSGHDLIGIAKTGSGKTLAFLLPMFRHIMDQRPLLDGEGPIAVIMTPTRELALQITKECKKFTKPLHLNAVCVYGGTGISEQIAELKRGAEIIICTPGRMIDMLAANSGRVTNMRRCTYMVLDEADRMFDMGFEPQVMFIINSARPERQTVMFSATFPRQMEALARRILAKPIEVQVGGRSVVCSDVAQTVVILNREQKFLKLLELLGSYQEQGSVLVFVDKQEHADSLLKDLMDSSYPCMALHGGIDQYDRDSVISDFKNGVSRLLIATSVAARGLDVKNLILVVNYDCPNHYEDYVHRCGRTGRAGNKGFAFTFIIKEQARHAGDIIKALELSGAPVPPQLETLWLNYKTDLKSQGKEVSKNSGFTGKGFKFDETEDELVRERKQFQKTALGMHDSDDESPVKDIDEQIENMFNSKKRVKDVVGPVLLHGAGGESAQPGGPLSGSNIEKLEIARRLASRINLKKNLGAEAQDVTQQAATAIMKGGRFQAPKVSAKTIAEQLAEKLNQKLNYVPQEKPEDEEADSGSTVKRYEEELEINDFPQTCRWKVTSKDTLGQISEYSEAGITIRGQYLPSGKTPEEDERKLYLAIEATSEMAVQKAKSEITRLIKEELIRLQNSYQPINKGRYKIT